MKKIIMSSLIVSSVFAIPPCEDGIKACMYLYKTGLSQEIIIINMENDPILFNANAILGGQSRKIKNRKLEPNQRLSIIKKRYKMTTDNKVEYSHLGFNYRVINKPIKNKVIEKFNYDKPKIKLSWKEK